VAARVAAMLAMIALAIAAALLARRMATAPTVEPGPVRPARTSGTAGAR